MCEIIEHKLGKTKRNMYLKRDREKEKAGVDVKIFRVELRTANWISLFQCNATLKFVYAIDC